MMGLAADERRYMLWIRDGGRIKALLSELREIGDRLQARGLVRFETTGDSPVWREYLTEAGVESLRCEG